MAKPLWKDVTSYSYNTKPADRVCDSAECEIAGVRVCVTRYIGHPPDSLFVICHGLDIHLKPLTSKKMVDAQEEGLELVRTHLARLSKAFGPPKQKKVTP